jgi:sulfur relay (sulfurtransferase) DsrC/TusE family protein
MMEIMKCLDSMDFVKDWQTWRETLHEAIAGAKKFGVSDDVVKDMSVKVGDFLAEKVCPATKEEQLLKEMWDVATPEERRTIAALMLKLVS